METIRRARRHASPAPRRIMVGTVAVFTAVTLFAGVSLATADLEQNEIADAFEANADSTTALSAAAPPRRAIDAAETPTTVPTRIPTTPPTTRVPVAPVEGRDTASTPPAAVGDAEAAATTVAGAPATTTPPTTAPPTTTPPTTAPPPTAPPPPPFTSLGVVTDPSTITPLSVPPAPPPPAIRLIGFGDSVMLGSADRLAAQGFVVDAVQSRQFTQALPELQAIRDNGFLGSAVVVHLGTNGSFPQSSLDQMMTILADVPIVVFVTGKADRVWIPGNNEKIRALPATHPNVTVLDWEVIGPQCPGDCFYNDQIHLNAAGQAYYADLISRLLGLE
jgi:hypothetical protein